MIKPEYHKAHNIPLHKEPLFGIGSLEKTTGGIFLDRLQDYIREYGDIFPSYQSSYNLINRVRETGLTDRMVEVEMARKHSLFSHSLLVCYCTACISEQLNALSKRVIGTYIVDTPLLVSSAFLHDIGNLIGQGTKEVVRLQDIDIHLIDLEQFEGVEYQDVDISPYVENYPQNLLRKIEREGLNHILKTIAFLEALGFTDHANTAAHSIYHLPIEADERRLVEMLHLRLRPIDQLACLEPSVQIEQKETNKIEPSDVTIERLILMMADFSVISLPNQDSFPKAAYALSFAHKMDQARSRHAGELSYYLAFHDQLQVIKSYMENANVAFPPYDHKFPQDTQDEQTLTTNLSSLNIYLAQRGIIRRSIHR